ncbi:MULTISPECIES: YceI family protein [unclassified Cryobacterium]|uniref:YceI family protein n=1 Tax=unclassified Cryobacterium TaxID=2649013 RepID=UPI00106BEA88|nr:MULTISPECIES: YceI family protein [unclassified Cryobacterium]TFC51024.1 YceI family protein [Cryobacterium sp. TMB3-1-2]TFC74370.1 YceI family protein [Cryobacterium sp. TMB3-15]TFC79883.1 YceI family protein [Cryobacterium sp. TMB3-10]TFD41784.1 YceI family protein [Cryobacterium sp. TMB3-12]
MQKKTKIGLWIAGGVVVIGGAALAFGPAVYADYANSTVEAAPTIAAGTPGPTDAGAATEVNADDLSGTWSVAADSFAGYRVDEVLQGNDVTVTGRTADVSGELTVDNLSLTAATITVDVASIATDEGARDAYFRDSAMEADDFPTAIFTLTAPVTLEAPVAGVAQTLSATGELTLHGVTQPVTVELQAALTEAGGQVVGSIPITFSDYGVDAPDLGFVSVEDAGSVEFELFVAQN